MKRFILMITFTCLSMMTTMSFARGGGHHSGGLHLSTGRSSSHTIKNTSHINIPKPKENPVHVKTYVKHDGTIIQHHDRTSPDKTQKNNWSSKPNTNPETGKHGTIIPKK